MNVGSDSTRSKAAELVLGSPETPLAWALLVWVAVAVAMSVGITALLGQIELSLFAIVPCVLSGVVAATVPVRRSLGAGVVFAVALSILQGLAVSIAHRPLAAAVLLGVVTFVATAMAAVPHWASAGSLLAMGYFVSAVYGYVMDIEVATPWSWAASLGLVGALLGATVVSVYRRVQARRKAAGLPHDAAFDDGATVPLVTSMRTMFDLRDPEVQFALARGVLGALGMWIFLRSGASRDAAWIFLTAFMTLQPALDKTLRSGLLRVAGAAAGVVAFGIVLAIVAPRLAEYLGFAGLALGLLFIQRSPILSNLGMTMFIIAIFGRSGGDYQHWAMARLIDVAIGGGLAILIGFVALPAIRVASGRPKGARRGGGAAQAGTSAAGVTAGRSGMDAAEADSSIGAIASGDSSEVGSDLGSNLPG